MKKIISILITAAVLLGALSMGIYAQSLLMTTTRFDLNGNSVLLSNSALEEAVNIDAETAEYIAELFIADMILTDDCDWDSDTDIVDVVTMYDETGTEATAYSVELTEGYVIVSAYADAESLIPEWSDTALPIYEELDVAADENIVYLGSYEYFTDNGTSVVTDLSGNTVAKSDLVNLVEESRDISNISDILIESCTVTPGVMVLNSTDTITNPYDHAKLIYNETFKSYESCNKWEQYFSTCYYYDTFTSDYEGCCVPICITNITLAHMRKYNLDYSYYFPGFDSANDLFDYIACMGEYLDVYDRDVGSVYMEDVPSYILYCLNEMSVGANVVGGYDPTYDNIKYHLNDYDLLALCLYNHPTYCDDNPNEDDAHMVLCYAYTRIRGTQSGNFKTYLKVADGWNPTPRYIDLSTVATYQNGEYVANDYCSYVRVEIWR